MRAAVSRPWAGIGAGWGRATIRASSDPTVRASTITAIGTAVRSPPRPARGAMTPAMHHCRKPSSAEPVPGCSGTALDARAPELAVMSPWAVMRTKKPTMATTSGMPHHQAPANMNAPDAPVGGDPGRDHRPGGDAPHQPGRDECADGQPNRVDGEDDRVDDRRQPVHRLQHERRRGDVGEGHAHREADQQQVADVLAVGQHRSGRVQEPGEPALVAPLLRQRLGHDEPGREQHHRRERGDPDERHPPTGQLQDRGTDQGADDRCDASDACQQVHRPDQLEARRSDRPPRCARSPSPTRR